MLRDQWDQLDDRIKIHQNEVLRALQEILQSATCTFDELFGQPQHNSKWEKVVAKMADVSKLRYAAYAKKSLAEIVTRLDKWHRLFDPFWYLLSRLSTPTAHQRLVDNSDGGNEAISTVLGLREAHSANGTSSSESPSTSVFLGADYQIQNAEAIPLAPAYFALNADGNPVIVDYYHVREKSSAKVAKKDVRDLARILSKVDPAFSSLLPCEGVLQTGDRQFNMIFKIPPALRNTSPSSLRSLLLQETAVYPLNERVQLAISLARSVVFLHASRIVHKNISPENIIVLQSDTGTIGTPFLVGFERFRFDERRTNMSGDDLWEKNLYRHPQRQGLNPEEIYSMRHDIYSVGVCLLEIGLWRSFVRYSDDQKVTSPASDLPRTLATATKYKRETATRIKRRFVELAQMHLPRSMGRIYADTVVACLTCLDYESPLFQDSSELEDEDGILVGVRYIEKVRQSVLRSYTIADLK